MECSFPPGNPAFALRPHESREAYDGDLGTIYADDFSPRAGQAADGYYAAPGSGSASRVSCPTRLLSTQAEAPEPATPGVTVSIPPSCRRPVGTHVCKTLSGTHEEQMRTPAPRRSRYTRRPGRQGRGAADPGSSGFAHAGVPRPAGAEETERRRPPVHSARVRPPTPWTAWAGQAAPRPSGGRAVPVRNRAQLLLDHVGVPSTIASSLASMGTEAARPARDPRLPGHDAGRGWLLNGLRWDPQFDPLRWQPAATIFERACGAGIGAVHVTPGASRGTGLSAATMRGAEFLPAATVRRPGRSGSLRAMGEGLRPPLCTTAASTRPGTRRGCSDTWLYELAHVDKLAEQLASAWPRHLLVRTADHGMVDVGRRGRGGPRGRRPLSSLGPGWPCSAASRAPGMCRAAWRRRRRSRRVDVKCSASGWVPPGRTPSTKAGRPGRPGDDERIGDVVAAPAGPCHRRDQGRAGGVQLFGLHGRLTPADQLVPC